MFLGCCTLLFLRPVTVVFNPHLYLRSIIEESRIKVLTEPFKSFISAEQAIVLSRISRTVLAVGCVWLVSMQRIRNASTREVFLSDT